MPIWKKKGRKSRKKSKRRSLKQRLQVVNDESFVSVYGDVFSVEETKDDNDHHDFPYINELVYGHDPMITSIADYIREEPFLDVFLSGYTYENGRCCIDSRRLISAGSPYLTLMMNSFHVFGDKIIHCYCGSEVGQYILVGSMLCHLEAPPANRPDFTSNHEFPILC